VTFAGQPVDDGLIEFIPVDSTPGPSFGGGGKGGRQHRAAAPGGHDGGTFKATKRQADAVVATLRANSEIVKPAAVPPGAVRNKDALPVLGAAISGSKVCIVTGDHELLALEKCQGIDVLTPRAFYERLRS